MGAWPDPGRCRRLLSGRGVGVLGTVLVLGVGVVVARRTVETDGVIAAIRAADPVVLTLAATVYLGSWPLRSKRYEGILAAMGRRCGVGFLTAAIFVSQTVNLVVPARAGDGVRAYLLNDRKQVPYTTGAASLTVERLFDLLALTAIGVTGFAWLLATGREFPPDRGSTFVVGAAGVALVGLVVTAVIVGVARSDLQPGGLLRERAEGRLSPLVEKLVAFGGDVSRVATAPRALATTGIWSLSVWVLDVVTALLVLGTLSPGVLSPFGLAAVGALAVTVGNLAKVLPLSQGGIGLYEAAFTAIVVAVSPIGAPTALAAAILDHALKNAVTLVGGVGAALGLNVSLRHLGRESTTADPGPSDF